MRTKRFFLTCGVLFLVAIAWNAFVHLVVLRAANASVQHLHRPDLAEKAWLSVLLTAGIVTAFVWGYSRFARNGSLFLPLWLGSGFLADSLNSACMASLPRGSTHRWAGRAATCDSVNIAATLSLVLQPPSLTLDARLPVSR